MSRLRFRCGPLFENGLDEAKSRKKVKLRNEENVYKSPGLNECSCMIKSSFHLLARIMDKRKSLRISNVWDNALSRLQFARFGIEDILDPIPVAAYYDKCIGV